MDGARRSGIIALTVGAALVLGAFYLWLAERHPGTDDAYVDADVVGIVAQVAGPIVNLAVQDNQPVRAGDLLFEIDPRPFRIQVAQARAQLDETGQNVSALVDAVTSAEAEVQQAEASLRLAQVQYKRIVPLAEIGAVSYQDRDRAQAQLDAARSGLADAEARLSQARHQVGEADEDNPQRRAAMAQLEQAELQLGYTRVVAPVNGYVTGLIVGLGSYASPGSPMLSLVNTDSWRVVAYLKETQLERVRPGQSAAVHLPAYSGVRFEGRVQGIAWGIQQQDGAASPGVLPSVSPTVDWVRMAQRFPVRIELMDRYAHHPLRKGMSASVRIDATAGDSEP